MRRLLLFLPFVASCVGVPLVDAPLTSVEDVLKETYHLGRELDDSSSEMEFYRGPAGLRQPAWQWPLKRVAINSGFGRRGGARHTGLDLKASTGTPVLAAAEGIVVFAADRISGYGNAVIVRHIGSYSTLYAHLDQITVEVSEKVERGQIVGYAGETGRASGPHLHFEVRRGLNAIDPKQVLRR